MFGGAVALLFQLVVLHIVDSRELRKEAAIQHYSRMEIEPKRGVILDRQGIPFTADLGDYVTLGVNPGRVIRPADLAKDLSLLTGRPASYYLRKLQQDSDYVLLARKVEPAVADKLELKGWQLIRQHETRRRYPHHRLAAQVIGFTDIDSRGISGVELACEPILRGERGWRVLQLDVRGRAHMDGALPSKPPIDGSSVVLTLDLAIQEIVEEELIPAISEEGAESASAIVLDPRTGELLAIATLPSFDPNSPDEGAVERQKIRPVVDLFEPGSTFKVFGAAYLLERGLAKSTTKVDCSAGSVKIYNRKISDSKKHGVITFEEVVAHSSNVGMIKLTWDVAADDLYDWIRRFGFASKSGVELQGEVAGILPKVKDWSGLTKPNLVIGHGISVTMLQMAMAYAAIANDGLLLQPSILKGRYTSDLELVAEPPSEARRVLSAQSARALTRMMTQVVEEGTATRAKLEGITVAGKTGTAQKIDFANNRYYKDRFVSSFIGYFPAEAPRFLVMLLLDDPKGKFHQGGQVAAPIFRNIAERIAGLNPEIRSLGKRRGDAPKESPVVLPDVRRRASEEGVTLLEKNGFAVNIHGEGHVIADVSPAPGSKLRKGESVNVTLGPAPQKGSGKIVVPYLTGLSLREAVAKASRLGLDVQVKGTGRVTSQMPGSGVIAQAGDRLILLAEG